MKFGLNAAEAWLESLTSVWKRVLFFWGCLIVSSIFGQKLVAGRVEMADILRLGGVTYVLLGPLNYLTLLIAPVVWFRFIHLEKSGLISFLLLAIPVGLNAGYEQKSYVSEASLRRLHWGVFIVGWCCLLFWAWRRSRRNGL